MKLNLNLKALFLGLVFFLFPVAHFKATLFGFPLYLSEIPLLIATGMILWELYREKFDWREFLRPKRTFFIGAGLFLLGAVLSYTLNPETLTGLGILKSFFFLPALLALLLMLTIRNEEGMRKILWLWLSGLALMAWWSLILAMRGEFTYDGRLAGIYESPNYLAMLLAPGLALSLYFFLTAPRRNVKGGSIFFFLILAIDLFLTRSYGALLSTFVSLPVFLWFVRKDMGATLKKFLLALCFAFITLCLLIYPTQKFQSLWHGDERSSLVSRAMIWKAAFKIGSDNAFIGIGPGNFQEKYLEYQKYFPPYLEWAVPEPHNLSLAFWLQTGLIGLSGFFIVLYSILRAGYRRWKENNLSPEERLLGSLLFSLLLFYLLYGLIDTPYFKNDLALAFWGTLGLLLSWSLPVRIPKN
ncbi:MAG: O-antigen ligase family protein [Candidatus Moraniibacteriota bacterium]